MNVVDHLCVMKPINSQVTGLLQPHRYGKFIVEILFITPLSSTFTLRLWAEPRCTIKG